MNSSLWGDEFVIDTKETTLQVLNKVANPKNIKGSKINSDRLKLEERLRFIKNEVYNKLGHFENNTQVITSREVIHNYIDTAIANKIISIDTETNNSLDPLTCKLMGVCIYTPTLHQAYIPLNHRNINTNVRLENQLIEEDIKEEFQRLIDNNVNIVMHNGKFDYQVIKCTCDIELPIYWDTMIASKLINENESAKLKDQYIMHIDSSQEKYSIDHLFEKIEYAIIEPSIFALYAATDAYITYKLYEYQKKIMESKEFEKIYRLFREVEMPCVLVTASMELSGVCLDLPYTKRLSEKYHKKSLVINKKIEQELDRLRDIISKWRKTDDANYHPIKNGKQSKSKSEQLDENINLGSPTQLAILFYDVLKVQQVNKDKPRGTGEEELKSINDKYNIPLCNLILEKRGIDKLLDTYIDKLPTLINSRTNRLHGHFNQYGANCITKDSLVLTKDGYNTIGNIIGACNNGIMTEQKITIVNKDCEFEDSSHSVYYKNQPTIKLNTTYGFEIEGTYQHKVMSNKYTKPLYYKNHFKENRIFKRLDDFKIGDYVEIPFGFNIFPKEKISLDISNSFTQPQFVENVNIPKVLDEDFAEFLGMYLANGSLSTLNDSFSIRISNNNAEVIDRAKYLFEKVFNLKASIHYSHTTHITYVDCKYLECLSKYFSKDTYNKYIVEEIMKSPKSVIVAFIRGTTLVSTYDSKRRQLNLTQPINSNAIFIQNALLNMGIVCSRCNYKKTNKLSISGNNYLKFIEEIGVIESNKIDSFSPSTRTKDLILGNSLWVSVKGIKYSQNDVYDFHIPQTHSFIANGLINHNTGRFSSSEPNLQNIPSHNKEIRMMFCAKTTYNDIKEKENNVFEISNVSKVLTKDGWKKVKEINIGDSIQDNEDNWIDVIRVEKNEYNTLLYVK